MQLAILPIFLFVACVVALAVGILLVGNLLNPDRPGWGRQMPYESGMDPVHDTHRRFDVRFHLLAIAFLIFDVEMLFLYPWAVASHPAPISPLNKGTNFEPLGADAAEDGSREAPSPLFQQAVTAAGQSAEDAASHAANPAQGVDAAVAAGWVENRHWVFAGGMVFLALLIVGYVYDWRKGIFQWR